MPRDDHNLFAGWNPTETPPDLGSRALAAARRFDRAARPHRLEDRIWHSRGLKLGWISATAALLLLNLWIPTAETPEPRGLYAVNGRTGAPVASTPRSELEERPRWSDQQMLLCKVLEDCARQADEARPAEGEDTGGRA